MPQSNETDWIVQVNESLKAMTSDDQQHWGKRSIYKAPGRRTNLNREAYQPLAVSFGPYHHKKYPHLLPVEEHKHRALLHFLKRSGKPFECFLESLREVEEDLAASYEALDPEWKVGSGEGTASNFLQLMITDGCFMLEILRTRTEEVNDYEPNDPIFSNHGKFYVSLVIERDMLLLENQLPMLVLDRLVAVCGDMKEDNYINRLILNFYFPSANNPTMGKCLDDLDLRRKRTPMDTKKKDKGKNEDSEEGKNKDSPSANNPTMGKCLHVLDVYRKSMLMETKKKDKGKNKDSEEGKNKDSEEGKNEDSEDLLLPATELHEHGVQFEVNDTNSLKNVSFASGVLRLPKFLVEDDTESIFLNLIAFELSHVGAGSEVMSYICFMDNIIDKGRDVALLRAVGIIHNYMESDEAAAKLFNSLGKDLMLDCDSSLRGVMNDVKEYCKKRRHMWRANLMHTHFRNPWVILSLIAAVVLFGLTAIQTVYAVLSYKK
ncbi:UPF0481 protein At3g47200-like [Syzygium oleosum]|uniref:UPF0481 protein At3g47200-like n=1 Tax=Syzygium oleosum TaxID=219896 RepID=UPI0011D224A3|nr:UPF0481 protein At3g47200-like [Syzygium oleosum]